MRPTSHLRAWHRGGRSHWCPSGWGVTDPSCSSETEGLSQASAFPDPVTRCWNSTRKLWTVPKNSFFQWSYPWNFQPQKRKQEVPLSLNLSLGKGENPTKYQWRNSDRESWFIGLYFLICVLKKINTVHLCQNYRCAPICRSVQCIYCRSVQMQEISMSDLLIFSLILTT